MIGRSLHHSRPPCPTTRYFTSPNSAATVFVPGCPIPAAACSPARSSHLNYLELLSRRSRDPNTCPPLFLAPMENLADRPMRISLHSVFGGFDEACTGGHHAAGWTSDPQRVSTQKSLMLYSTGAPVAAKGFCLHVTTHSLEAIYEVDHCTALGPSSARGITPYSLLVCGHTCS